VEVEHCLQLLGETHRLEQVCSRIARRATLSSYAGPIPRPVVPILLAPCAASRAWSSAPW